MSIIWTDNQIVGQWIEVTVKATSATALGRPDVFYFGNAIGETGNVMCNAIVDYEDELATRNYSSTSTAITSRFDFDRNGKVDLADQQLAKSNVTNYLTSLKRLWAVDAILDLRGDANNDGVTNEIDNSVEDIYGDSLRPGQVILVDDDDSDGDGIVDLFDGYNSLVGTTDDDESSVSQFVPLELDLRWSQASPIITLSYDASNPANVTSSLADPFVLPAGKLRLWKVDGDAIRNKASVLAGGDYIAPGSYLPSDLGLDSEAARTTLWVEAVRESQSVGDLLVSITLNVGGCSVTDRFRFNSVRMELVGHGYGETQYTSQLGAFTSYFGQTDQSLYSAGRTPGAYMVHRANIYDPRSWASYYVTINGSSLPLQRVSGILYQTADFVVSAPDSMRQPQFFSISIGNGDLNWSYNPKGARKLATPFTPTAWDTELSVEIEKIVKLLKDSNWTPANPTDAGAFGTAVHQRLSATFAAKPEWVVDIYVENGTNRVVAGAGPNRTQVDLLRVKPGYRPQVGEILDVSRVDDLYDIKTSIKGSITADQRDRLKRVINGGTNANSRSIKLTRSSIAYKAGTGWRDNLRVGNLVKVLGILGLAKCAFNAIESDAYADEFDALVREAARIRRTNDTTQKAADTALWIKTKLQPYLSHFVPSDDALNIGMNAATYKVISQIVDQ